MEHKLSLALAFLETHPDAAAAVLEQHPAEKIAEFLAQVPPAQGAAVFQRLLPPLQARVCESIHFEAGLNLLLHLDAHESAAVLRQLSPGRRSRYLKELPANRQVTCKLLLGYAANTVGAYATPSVMTAPHDASVREALRILKQYDAPVRSELVFLVDRRRKLTGRLKLVELLRAPEEAPVRSLVEGSLKTIQARRSLQEAAAHPAWARQDFLAVLNRRNEFFGILRHADLRKAHAAHKSPPERPELITGVAQGYAQSLLALFQSMQEFVMTDLKTGNPPRNT